MGRRASWIAIALCLPLFALVLWKPRAGSGDRAATLEDFGELPQFHLTESSGRTLDRDRLEGKVWIASFLFTHCPAQCPMLVSKLKRVASRLKDQRDFRLVSFTVDPQRDTPAVLAAYAEKHGAPRDRWYFVTGRQRDLDALSLNGFRLGSGGPPTAHSFKVVLIDAESRIRGYYDGLDDNQLARLAEDARALLRRLSR